MIKSHQVQHGGMQVMDVDLVFDSLVTEDIGVTVGHAALDAASCKPDCEAVMIVVYPIQ